LCLVSLDATTRSNITVGPPFEVATYPVDSMALACRCKFESHDPYLLQLREAWNNGVRKAFDDLPDLIFDNALNGNLSAQALQQVR
jgi:putative proteasome-type protease